MSLLNIFKKTELNSSLLLFVTTNINVNFKEVGNHI